MAVTGSPFCEHKKLRTGCPICKAGAIPPPSASPLRATPFVSADEREKAEEKAARRAALPREEREREERKESKTPRPTGPGKPLMPTRAKKKGVTADEAAAAKPWWVRK